MNAYDTIIGLEIHVELATDSKMFCACANRDDASANTNVCPICLGHPGTLPLLNQQAVILALRLGTALDCQINLHSKFDRKNYFYPDLPKGYQISQYDQPIGLNGHLPLSTDQSIQSIGITRLHLEEDTGKLNHGADDQSLVDFNRAGVPLIELVTKPMITDAGQAKNFCQTFQRLLRSLQISTADMEKGQMRCEVNISLQAPHHWRRDDDNIVALDGCELNHKVEIKNLNSFRAVEKAITFEIARQTELLDRDEQITAETRGWDEAKNQTVSQRRKETAADYRYFPEPDLPPLVFSAQQLAEVKKNLPELPWQKFARLQTEYGLNDYDSGVLLDNPSLLDYAQKVFEQRSPNDFPDFKKIYKQIINLLTNELLAYLNSAKIKIEDLKFQPQDLLDLINLLKNDKISSSASKIILQKMLAEGGQPEKIMVALNLGQINDQALQTIIQTVIADYPEQVAKYRAGKTALLPFFVGKVIAASRGTANPTTTAKLLEKELTK